MVGTVASNSFVAGVWAFASGSSVNIGLEIGHPVLHLLKSHHQLQVDLHGLFDQLVPDGLITEHPRRSRPKRRPDQGLLKRLACLTASGSLP